MKVHSDETINYIKVLRKGGKSVPEIMNISGLSKTTIWHHVHSIKLSEPLSKHIASNQGGSRKRYEASLLKAKIEGNHLMNSTARPLCIAIGMLYWAEGSKRELVFTNTDAHMIRLYLKFLNEILKVPRCDVSLLIRISDPINPSDARKFWLKNTKIHHSKISINHDNIQNKTKTLYGICRVNVKKNSYYLKVIQCIIDSVKKDMLP